VWAYSAVGFPEMDAVCVAAGFPDPNFTGNPRPAIVVTPLPLSQFPVNATTGLPDLTQFVAAGGSLFDLTTGDVFAIHVGSEPDPGAPGRRRGYGYSLRHLLDMVRASIRGAKLGPVCPD